MLAMGALPSPHPLKNLRPQIIGSHSHSCVFFSFDLKSSKRVFASNTPFQAVPELDDADGTCSHLPNQDDKDASPGIVSTTKSASPTPSSFRKLKAHKLKVLMKRSSLVKEKTYGETMVTGMREDTKTSNAYFKHGEHQMLDYEIMQDDSQRSFPKRAGPKRSAPGSSYSRGWGNVGHVHSLKSKSTKPLQQQQIFSADNDFFSRKSFKDLGCTCFMIESLKGQFFVRPSHIQAMAFTPVIEGKSCVIADQSGSGKTLAYLVPIIQRLRLEELQGLGESVSKSPQVLIMVPTAELASQVLNNCRSISKFGVPFRSMVATGGFSQRTQLENLEQGVDILIVTPGRFTFLVKEGFLQQTNLKCVVLDEVDILFNDEDFEVALNSLMNSSPVATQYLFVTATLPVDVYNKLVEIFPDCEVIMGPGMHRTSTRLEEVLVDCSGEIGTERTPDTAFLNKKSALLRIMEQSPVSKTIVFCNKIETCRKVENVLKRFDRKGTNIRVLPFHAALAKESRLANMTEFMNSPPGENSLFLVCTDRASRGIDFTGVDHVILFDFPRDPSEYVRRVGRTARGATGKGKAFVFGVGKQVSLAQRIIERNRKGHPLHDVPSAYELMS
ncbi:hypothetical protein GH714_007513 [Hevea brasiliensis]|uniref:DEAD-box ATP-dependent RNA helicase 50 n=1 Tax=Hevea brasiliensis TaxID=3981 RepID=A0A6A6KVU5_HEVBR|nr:hypothetical protein GH714_007513 [Hevea brasiliensis]